MNTKTTKGNQTALRDRANQIDSQVIQTCSLLADKYNVKADIDIETREIDFTGGTDQEQQELAREIEEILRSHTI